MTLASLDGDLNPARLVGKSVSAVERVEASSPSQSVDLHALIRLRELSLQDIPVPPIEAIPVQDIERFRTLVYEVPAIPAVSQDSLRLSSTVDTAFYEQPVAEVSNSVAYTQADRIRQTLDHMRSLQCS